MRMSLPAKHDADWFRVKLGITATEQDFNAVRLDMISCIIKIRVKLIVSLKKKKKLVLIIDQLNLPPQQSNSPPDISATHTHATGVAAEIKY